MPTFIQICYQDGNAICNRARTVTTDLQQEVINKMEQPTKSSDGSHIKHIWDGLGLYWINGLRSLQNARHA